MGRPDLRPGFRCPWLVWDGGQDGHCKRCGRRVGLPWGCTISTLVRYIDAVAREHRDCRPRPDDEPYTDYEGLRGYW